MHRILIIEDDIGISKSLKLYLENSNYKVYLYHEGNGAIEKINEIDPDLVILDINLPGKDGIQITKEFRIDSKTPIIILTARGSESDRINGLDAGADDYIAKPFSPRELLARINTILRRVNTGSINTTELIQSLGIKIDTNKKIVKYEGNIISLTGNEYDILKKLVIENGSIVTRETIMTEIIGYDKYIYDRTIDTHIKNLRRKIGNKNLILTIRGEGYRINV